MKGEALCLFALDASREFGQRVADALAMPLAEHEERDFEDGEHKSRPLQNVRGRDVFVIQSLYSDNKESVNDKLCRLLFFCGAIRDASAASVTLVIPYLAYARKDRKTQTRDPVNTRYMASLIEAVGVDRVLTLDVHNLAAYQNAFRIHADHLDTDKLFLDHLLPQLDSAEQVSVVSPDIGGVKRAERFRQALARRLQRDVGMAFVQKARAKGKVSYGQLVGEVEGGSVVILDDMIGTGGTLVNAARACKAQGASRVMAAAAHGIFVGEANELLAAEALDRVVVTDSISPFRLSAELLENKVEVITAAELFAEAIRRIHEGGSLVDLLAT